MTARRPARSLQAALLGAVVAAIPGVEVALASEAAAARERSPLAPFGFRSLEIYKASSGAVSLVAVDLDGDGRLDLAYPDNSDGTLRLLMQRSSDELEALEDPSAAAQGLVKSQLNEVASDPRFRVEKFYTGKHLSSVVVDDFDGDGKSDVAYYSDPAELEVLFQSEPWGERREKFSIRDGLDSPYALEAADLNGDGRAELILLARGKTYILYQKPNGGLEQPTEVYAPAEGIVDLEIGDIDGDGRPDLVYFVPAKETSIHVQLQGKRGFGPSLPQDLGPLRAWMLASFRLGGEPAPRPTLFCIERSSKQLKLYRWRTRPRQQKEESVGLSPAHIIPLSPDGDPTKRNVAITDVDGDGRNDLVVSYPDVAQLQVQFQDSSGELSRKATYPTLAAVNGLASADVDGDGARETIVVSAQEKALGVSFFRDGRLQFPVTVHLDDDPLAIASAPRRARDGADAPGRLFLVSKVRSGGYELRVVRLAEERQLHVESATPLSLQSEPTDLRLLDANGDGHTDALLFVPYARPTLLLQVADGAESKFRDVSQESKSGFGQLSGVLPAALSVAPGAHFPLEGRDRPVATAGSRAELSADVLLLCRKKYARALRLDENGQLRVIEQFSGRGASAELTAVGTLQLGGDAAVEVALLDAAAREVEVQGRGPDNTYARRSAVEAPELDLDRLEVADMNGDGAEDLVLIGRRQVAVLHRRTQAAAFREIFSHAVDEEKDLGSPADLTVGDLNADGWLDVVLVTAPRYNLFALSLPGEIVKGAERPADYGESADRAVKATLEMRLAFPIFEEKSYMRRGSGHGPRQMTVADVDGDALEDLIVLIHDRILVYLQDSVP